MTELDRLRLILIDSNVSSEQIEIVIARIKKDQVELSFDSYKNISLTFQGIKSQRESLGVSQNEISKHLNVAEATISTHEKNSYLNIKVRDGLKILRYLSKKGLK